ncbi:hypothetical protein L1987_58636 [Smallanthus sonchifolius]|uniref:Uncharacterized protein n=1 Tax=Smallanthus sonchifolius TaxID=185202 RepID=A0ACB9DG36_9ASTR|nr:hypothetical protein L1987_58636 [Smallanthus sonchifolius]
MVAHGKVMKTMLRLGISELLEGLGVEDDDEHVPMKLVPKCDNVHVIISGDVIVRMCATVEIKIRPMQCNEWI